MVGPAGARGRKSLTYLDYLRSDDWRQLREEVFARDGWRCMVCNAPETLEGHHRRYPYRWASDSRANVTTLCRNCHALHHGHNHAILRHRLIIGALALGLAVVLLG